MRRVRTFVCDQCHIFVQTEETFPARTCVCGGALIEQETNPP